MEDNEITVLKHKLSRAEGQLSESRRSIKTLLILWDCVFAVNLFMVILLILNYKGIF